MFSIFFVVLCIVTDNIQMFEGVYFLMAVVDLAWVAGAVAIADMLRTK